MASSPPSDQHMSSSMVSPWPAMAFNNAFQEELKTLPPAIVGSNGVSLSPPAPLSSQASMGGSSKKVSKRRLKPAPTKLPIRVFSTDRSNFKEMVHKLTGIVPTSPSYMQGRIGFQHLLGSNPSPVLKLNATHPNSQNDDAAAAQTLPRALDTSSAYLLPSQEALLHDEINNINSDLAFPQSLQHPQPHMGGGSLCSNSTAFYNRSSSTGADWKPLFARQRDASKNTSMSMERVVGEEVPHEMEHVLQAAELESLLLMSDDDDNLDDLFPYKVDSWLPSDAIHMELAHSMTA